MTGTQRQTEHAEQADGQEQHNRNDQYETLYRAHHDRIVRLCRLLLNDPAEADEAAQDAFMRLLRAGAVWENPAALESWLTRFAVNACHDKRRSRWWKVWREKHMDFTEEHFSSCSPTPEESTISREKRSHIWQLFQTLSARQKEVFVLRYVEGRTGDDVAQLLGISTGSVKQHLFRAVRHMRKALGER